MPKLFGQQTDTPPKEKPAMSVATDAPADAPATDAPATDAPATDAPATGAPATPEVLNGVTSEDKAKRGRPKISELPDVPLDDLGEDDDVPEDEWGDVTLADRNRQVAERSATQMEMDRRVAAIYRSWVDAGKPQLALAPRKRVTVKPEFEAATRAMLTRAGVLHKVRVIQDTLHNGQGNAVITYTAIDRPPKPEKAEDKAEVKADA